MEEILLKILTKRRSQRFYERTDVQSVAYSVDESVSSISIGNIVNQLGKHDLSCGYKDATSGETPPFPFF